MREKEKGGKKEGKRKKTDVGVYVPLCLVHHPFPPPLGVWRDEGRKKGRRKGERKVKKRSKEERKVEKDIREVIGKERGKKG